MKNSRKRADTNDPRRELIALGGSRPTSTTQGPTSNRASMNISPQPINSTTTQPKNTSANSNAAINTTLLQNSKNIVNDVLANFDSNNMNMSEGLILSCLNYLSTVTSATPEHKYYFVSLAQLCKSRSNVFNSEAIIEKMIQILQQTPALPTPNARKTAMLTRSLIITILMRIYAEVPEWPLEFVKAYVDDCLNERLWVDLDSDLQCKLFINNVLTAYQPVQPDTAGVYNRYQLDNESIILQIRDYTISQLRMSLDKSKNTKRRTSDIGIIKLCISSAIYAEVRLLVAQNLAPTATDGWLNQSQAPQAQGGSQVSQQKLVKELLEKIALFMASSKESLDAEVFSELLKMKLKNTKIQETLFTVIIPQIVANENFQAQCIEYFLKSEYEHHINRNIAHAAASIPGSGYLKTLAQIYKQISGSHPAIHFGYVLQVFAQNPTYIDRELKKIVWKAVKFCSPDLEEICTGLLTPREHIVHQPYEIRERWVNISVDLITIICAGSKVTQSKDSGVDVNEQVSRIQANCLEWFNRCLPSYLPELTPSQYAGLVSHCLLLKPVSTYLPEAVQDSERILVQSLCNELALQEKTLKNMFSMGRMYQDATLDLVYSIVYRAALYSVATGKNQLQMSSDETLLSTLQISVSDLEKQLPANTAVVLPDKKQVCIRHLFWRSCIVMLILTAFNLPTQAETAMKIPTIKFLLDHSIKNQLAEIEIIHESEIYLTEERQLISFYATEMAERNTTYGLNMEIFQEGPNDPRLFQYFLIQDFFSEIRVPPPLVLQQIIKLDKELRIANNLRNSRDPDLLSDIMRREGPQQSLPWLTSIILGDISTLAVLPIPILCELFLAMVNKKDRVHVDLVVRMVGRLGEWLFNSSVDNSYQVLSFFLIKLADKSEITRRLAKQCLQRLLSPDNVYHIDMDVENQTGKLKYGVATEQYSWLHRVSLLICWPQSKDPLWNTFVAITKVDTDTSFIATYTEFLYVYYVRNALEISLVLSDLMIHRQYLSASLFSTMTNAVNFHALVQKIFVEAFVYLRSTQMMIASHDPATQTLTRMSDDREFRMPNPYLQGLIAFVSLPITFNNAQVFTAPMIEKINFFIDHKSKILLATERGILEEPILTESLAMKLLYSNSSLLIQKALQAVQVSGMIELICTFGVPKDCVVVITQHLASNYLEREDRRQLLLFEIKKLSPYQTMQFLNCIEEQQDQSLKDFVKRNVSRYTDQSDVDYMADDIDMVDHIQPEQATYLDWDTNRLQQIFKEAVSGTNVHSLITCLTYLASGGYNQKNDEFSSFANKFITSLASLVQIADWREQLSTSVIGFSILTSLYHAKERVGDPTFSQVLDQSIIPLVSSQFLALQQMGRNAGTQLYLLYKYDNKNVDQYESEVVGLLDSGRKDIIPPAFNHVLNAVTATNRATQHTDMLMSHFTALVQRGSCIAEELLYSPVYDQKMALSAVFNAKNTQRDIIGGICTDGMFVDLLLRVDPTVNQDTFKDIVFAEKYPQAAIQHKNLSKLLTCMITENGNFQQYAENLKRAHLVLNTYSVDEVGVLEFTKILLEYQIVDQNVPSIIIRCLLRLVSRGITITELLNNSELSGYTQPLLSLISENKEWLKECIQLLQGKMKESTTDATEQQSAKELFLWLYSCYPDECLEYVILSDQQQALSELATRHDLKTHLSTNLDKMMHRINKVLLNNPVLQSREGQNVPHFAYSLLRQMAFTHPFIVMRYLGSITALLETDFSATEMITNALSIYSQVLSVIDALQPFIFEQKEPLNQILENFFNLLGTVVPNQHDAFLPLIGQFSDFMCHYVMHLVDIQNSSINATVQFLFSHMNTLTNLQSIFGQVQKVKVLTSTIERLSILAKNNYSENSAHQLCLINKQDANALPLGDHNITLLRSHLRSRDYQLKHTLSYLDKLSQHSPAILFELITPLLDLCSMESRDDYNTDEIRSTSYNLIVRCLQFDSKQRYKLIIPKYLNCFMHRDRNVRLYAVRYAFDLFPFCNEFMQDLLLSLFYQQEQKEAMLTLSEILKMYIKV